MAIKTVEIDISKGVDIADEKKSPEILIPKGIVQPDRIPMEPGSKSTDGYEAFLDNLQKASEVKDKAVNSVKNVFGDIRMGKNIDAQEMMSQVSNMTTSILDEKSALLSLARLKSFDEYTFTHSVNVAVFCLVLAKKLGYSASALQTIGMGGILHDVGKMLIPIEILK